MLCGTVSAMLAKKMRSDDDMLERSSILRVAVLCIKVRVSVIKSNEYRAHSRVAVRWALQGPGGKPRH